MPRFCLLLLAPFLFQSCLSMKEMDAVPPMSLPGKDIKQLNGTYENWPVYIPGNERGDDLHKLLFKPYYTYLWAGERNHAGKVGIEVQNDNRLKITYFGDNNLIETRTLKGKYNNGFFIVKRKVRALGIPFLYFSYHERRTMLGINEQQELVVKTGKSDFGNLLILTGGSNEILRYNYKKG
ncbi:MAG: hypothetical protein IT262_11645 [Saprospiraceae bacterium]|nr:hypothetical protein [Saprospiraceae bacterium]